MTMNPSFTVTLFMEQDHVCTKGRFARRSRTSY